MNIYTCSCGVLIVLRNIRSTSRGDRIFTFSPSLIEVRGRFFCVVFLKYKKKAEVGTDEILTRADLYIVAHKSL